MKYYGLYNYNIKYYKKYEIYDSYKKYIIRKNLLFYFIHIIYITIYNKM